MRRAPWKPIVMASSEQWDAETTFRLCLPHDLMSERKAG